MTELKIHLLPSPFCPPALSFQTVNVFVDPGQRASTTFSPDLKGAVESKVDVQRRFRSFRVFVCVREEEHQWW